MKRLILPVLLALALPLQAAENLMVRQAPTDPDRMGWTLVWLSAASFLVAANGYTSSQDALDEAETQHQDYQAATSAAEANRLHRATEASLDKAVAYESTANGGVYLSLALGIAAWYAFNTEPGRDEPMLLLGANAVGWRLRF